MSAWHDSMTNNHKQWLLSIDMKTKVVQHVPLINISTWHMTAWQHDMTAWHDSMTNNHKQWLLSIDMKTKVVQHVLVINISTWHMTAMRAWHDRMTAWHDSMTNNHKKWLLSIDMKHFLVPSCCHFDIFNFSSCKCMKLYMALRDLIGNWWAGGRPTPSHRSFGWTWTQPNFCKTKIHYS